ncbi:Fic/DOC family protein [Achromobacter kerstersii]|uniref:protein adenylyltransferase n=1 Tax=Achromobacter kerstersii TaxID=1353890 RepID=A0A6S7AQ89_9BURK|nr:Fic family protein [Achromobacter kerstersii]CAB3743316.1 hypothetical protein LMG3441_05977 [Achromobacter kerstersii]
MAKYPINAQDPYVDPVSGVVRNRLAITDQAELDKVEATLAAVRSYELATDPIRGQFDLAHLQQIHQRLFGEVYDWAGKIRTVDISKGTTRFASHEQITSYAPQITRPLSREGLLKGLPPDLFSERAGHYLGELNVLHPFREGNGRSIREFIGQLARDAGYGIDWHGVDLGEMTKASIEAYQGDSQRMTQLIRANLQEIDREYALDLARAVAGDRAHVVQAIPGQSYEGGVIGLTERTGFKSKRARLGMVLHSRRTLLHEDLVVPGQMVGIRYPHGGVGLVERTEPQAEQAYLMQHQRDRDLGW